MLEAPSLIVVLLHTVDYIPSLTPDVVFSQRHDIENTGECYVALYNFIFVKEQQHSCNT